MYDHVLVGTDGSTRGTIAVLGAARLAQRLDAQLTIAHAYRRGRVVSVPGSDGHDQPRLLTARAAAEAVLASAVDHAQAVACGGLRVDTHMMPGHTTPVMLALARWLQPGVVVIGDVNPAKPLGRRSLRSALEHQGLADLIVIPTSDRADSPARPRRRVA